MKRARQVRPRTFLASVGTAAASALVSACSAQPQPHGPPPISVTSAHITRGDMATYVSFDGQITPLYQTPLSTAQAGTIDTVNVTEANSSTRAYASRLPRCRRLLNPNA